MSNLRDFTPTNSDSPRFIDGPIDLNTPAHEAVFVDDGGLGDMHVRSDVEEEGTGRNKLFAGLAVAVMVGIAGAYGVTTFMAGQPVVADSKLPQPSAPSKVAAMTPPPAPVAAPAPEEATTPTPAAMAPAAPDVAKPAPVTKQAASTSANTDPLWRVPVRLSAVEVALLRTEPLRRLHFVAHGGASTVTTLQSYSRLEHTLGVLALVTHFCPDDEPLRVAALLHDIGHLPLSHTMEGVSGLDHHAIGTQLLAKDPVRTVLARHGVSPDAVGAALGGESSPLNSRSGLLSLDHLDSYVRSGRAAGRLDSDPALLLAQLALVGSAVSADRGTAGSLVDLIRAEARLHTSWDNVGPVSVVRRLAARLLDSAAVSRDRLARMTDPQLWSAFDSCPGTRAETTMLRYEPHRLRVVADPAPGHHRGWDFSLRKIYSSAPLVNGERLQVSAPESAAELQALHLLPTRFHVWWD